MSRSIGPAPGPVASQENPCRLLRQMTILASELMAEEQRADVQTRLTRIIQDNSKRIERMVHDVLELGRRDRCTPETIPLEGFVAAFLADSEAYEALTPGLVGYDGQPGLSIRFDRIHLQQLLWNLVGNARRFCSGARDSIRIEARWLDDGHVRLCVLDDGPGIPLEMRSRIFEPFFTTDSRGTGLGLYIARELASANEGQLELRETRSGACFCLTAEGANEFFKE